MGRQRERQGGAGALQGGAAAGGAESPPAQADREGDAIKALVKLYRLKPEEIMQMARNYMMEGQQSNRCTLSTSDAADDLTRTVYRVASIRPNRIQ